jgi:hypothetical protein
MKRLVVPVFFAVALCAMRLGAADFVWSGRGRAGDWNDIANWEPSTKVPGAGDGVYMNRTVTIGGESHHVALPIAITSPIVLGEGKLRIFVGTSVTNIVSGPISGVGGIEVSGNNSGIGQLTRIQNGNNAWTSALVLSGNNSYSGGTSAHNVFLRGDSVSAFGAEGASVTFSGDASVSLNASGKWRGYAFRIGKPANAGRPLSLQFGESLEWNGSLVCDDDTSEGKLYLLAREGVKVDAQAKIDAPKLNLYPAFHASALVDFRNGVRVKAFCSDGGSVGTCGGLSRLYAGSSYDSTQIGFVFNVCCMNDFVFDESKVLNFWSRYGNANTGWCDLNGRDQRAKGLVSSWDVGADYAETGNYLGSRNGVGATMCLVGARQDCLYRGLLTNEVSVVWMPDGDYTQIFSNRVHETTGRLVVSNGTMRIAGSATFRKVSEIIVADGAAFECFTSATDALSGLRRLVVGNGATFTVGNGTPIPFSSGKTELVIRGSGKVVLPAGKRAVMKTTIVDGLPPASGVYDDSASWVDGGEIDAGNDNVTCWRNAVDGSWSAAENWSAGVPTASSVVFVTVDGADYTLEVDTAADLGKELHLCNGGTGTAKLLIKSDAVMKNGFITIGDGGELEIAEGGRLAYDGKSEGVRTASASAEVISVGGGKLVVDGGVADFTGMCGRMRIKSGERGGGRIEIRNGSFRHLQDSWSDQFTLEKGGRVEVSGGRMEFDSPAGVNTVGFRLYGGDLLVTGGVFGVGAATDNADMRFHNGTMLFGGTGVLQLDEKIGTKCQFITEKSADALKVRFEGRSSITPADIAVFHAGGTSTGNVDIDWCSSAYGETSPIAYRTMIGHQSGGSAVMNISNAVYRAGAEGVHVAFSRLKNWPSTLQKGAVNVGSAGRLIIEGFGASQTGYSNCILMGLMIGYSGYAAASSDARPCAYPFDGEMNIFDDGVARVLYGDVGVGVGRATGRLNVDGGSLSVNDHDQENAKWDYALRTFGIGLFGGVGVCTFDGGAEFSCGNDVFVGGTVVERYPYQGGAMERETGITADHSATGTLVVADAAVSIEKDVVLGMDGFGTIRRLGSEGSFAAANLVCTNVAAERHTGSRIDFVADAEGIGALDFSGSAEIGANAKLSVDLSAYSGGRRSFRLLGCSSRSGEFAEMKVIGLREDLAPARFEWTSRGLYLKTRKDLTMFVR